MKIKEILKENKATLIENHFRQTNLLVESICYDLTKEQKFVVENIYKEFKPLIEATLTADQIQQIFTNVESGITAGGSNRTFVGQSKDVVDKANEIINKAGKWIQDTRPVQAFDAKFEQLKNTISKKFPGIANSLSSLGEIAKNNPGKTAAVVGILTALASLAGGPVGGAIAGQVLRGSVELLKGEKLSTAIGKGIKTAVFGYLSGKAFELLGDFAKSLSIKSIPFGPESAGFERISFNAAKTIRAPGMEWTRRLTGVDIIVDPEIASAVRAAKNLLGQGGSDAAEGFEELARISKIINSPDYKKMIVDTLEISRQELIKNDSLTNWINAAKEGLQSVSQGAVAAAGVNQPKTQPTESLSYDKIKQIFKECENSKIYVQEGMFDTIKNKIGSGFSSVVNKAKTVGKNITTKITADKLMTMWKQSGSPTDSDDIATMLQKAGISADVLRPIYASMKLALPGELAQPIDFETLKNSISKLKSTDARLLVSYIDSLG